jgi:hypothetical protein
MSRASSDEREWARWDSWNCIYKNDTVHIFILFSDGPDEFASTSHEHTCRRSCRDDVFFNVFVHSLCDVSQLSATNLGLSRARQFSPMADCLPTSGAAGLPLADSAWGSYLDRIKRCLGVILD